jgi:hypothetical protein
MKRLGTFAALTLVVAATALADGVPRTDYSQDTMLSFTREVLRQREAERVDLDLGAIDIYHFGTHARFYWLPALAPLPGTRLNETATLPNPFALTQTAIARSMPYMTTENSAAINREVRRVLRMEKKRAKIKVTTQ